MGRSLLVFCRPDCARELPERKVFSFQYYRQIDYMLGQNRGAGLRGREDFGGR